MLAVLRAARVTPLCSNYNWADSKLTLRFDAAGLSYRFNFTVHFRQLATQRIPPLTSLACSRVTEREREMEAVLLKLTEIGSMSTLRLRSNLQSVRFVSPIECRALYVWRAHTGRWRDREAYRCCWNQPLASEVALEIRIFVALIQSNKSYLAGATFTLRLPNEKCAF